jgi:hypothetical protein
MPAVAGCELTVLSSVNLCGAFSDVYIGVLFGATIKGVI